MTTYRRNTHDREGRYLGSRGLAADRAWEEHALIGHMLSSSEETTFERLVTDVQSYQIQWDEDVETPEQIMAHLDALVAVGYVEVCPWRGIL